MEVVYDEEVPTMNLWRRLAHRVYYTLTGYPWRWAKGKHEAYECCEAQICADIRASGWNPEN
jgi:hypothetical protein